MTSDSSRWNEFDALVCSYLDGRLTEPEARQLDETLRGDDKARARFLKLSSVHAELAWDWSVAAGSGARRVEGLPPATNLTHPASAWRGVMFIGIASALLFVLVGWWLLRPDHAKSDSPVATLTRTVACKLSDDAMLREIGYRFTPGQRVELQAGLMELSLDRGATVVLQGPASAEIANDNGIHLHRGGLTATVPPSAVGFSVRTPGFELRDRGTEFGMRVAPSGKTELHVFRGSVVALPQAETFADRREIAVAEGEGLQIDPSAGTTSPMPASDDGFARNLHASQKIFDWQGDYVAPQSGRQTSLYALEPAVEDVFDSREQVTGQVRRHRFREFEPLSPELPSLPPGRSGVYSGGMEIWRLGPDHMGHDSGIVDQGASDRNRLWHANGKDRRLYGLWVFPKAEFLDLNAERIHLGAGSALSVRVATNEGSHFGVRFVVESGDKYFLSQSATNVEGLLTLAGEGLAREMWAHYHPLTDLRAAGSNSGSSNPISNLTSGAGTLPFDTTTAALSDVTAVGLYAESVDTLGWPNRTLDWDAFTVHAEPFTEVGRSHAP